VTLLQIVAPFPDGLNVSVYKLIKYLETLSKLLVYSFISYNICSIMFMYNLEHIFTSVPRTPQNVLF
jgi:hypothetical protein